MSEWMLIDYQNPAATPGSTLTLPVLLLPNTPVEAISEYTRINCAKPLRWLAKKAPHERVAVIVGGGPSLKEFMPQLVQEQGTIFALNGASRFIRERDIATDWQVMCDAQRGTRDLVDPLCRGHLLASSMHPVAVDAAPDPVLWHPLTEWVEAEMPPERRKRGGYGLIGGGISVGLSAICVAYCMGYRRFHLYGMDSSHHEGNGHAYAQPMNEPLQVLPVPFGGRMYWATVTMRAQAERFQMLGQELQRHGCVFEIHGDGLLPDMWRINKHGCPEREKYRRMWEIPQYRATSPGEKFVETFLKAAKPEKDQAIIDFGCGTGRAGLALSELGHEVLLIDLVDNSRDSHTRHLPFLEWDLTLPVPTHAPWGLCTDVMEHLPPGDVETVIRNIMAAADRCMFQIATVHDQYGYLIGHELHLTVRSHDWWLDTFARLGFGTSKVWITEKKVQFMASRSKGEA